MRGLSRELAIAGHDYFEVVFYYKGTDPSTDPDVIARTSWELYKDARITGVRGKTAGDVPTNYGNNTVGYTAVYDTGTNVAPPGFGAAILFVGKKTDRTLLAVGRLAQVDGAAGTTITPTTATVTFDVSALKSGINAPGGNVSAVGSGFYTDYSFSGTRDPNGNVNTSTDTGGSPNTTNRTTFEINSKAFPMYKLLQGSTKTHAQYHFALDGGTFANYQNGIILAGAGSYGKKQPRYPTTNGQFQYASLRLDNKTIIEPVVNNIVGAGYNPAVNNPPAYFNPIIRVSFDTSNVTAQGSAFAFVFEIPVHPLSAIPATDGAAAGTWYIRPSYDSFFLDLDDGTGAAGGAVLMGIGNPETNSDFRIRVVRPPRKWKYNGLSPANYDQGRYFNVDDLVVWLETYSTTTSRAIRRLDEHTELTYELGMKRIRPNTVYGSFNNPATRGEEISNLLYGLQTVTVRYAEPGSGATRTNFFYIICDNDEVGKESRYTDIPANHYFAFNSFSGGGPNQFLNFNSLGSRGPGTYVIVLEASINMESDIGAFQLAQSPSLFILVARNNNLALGRQDDGGRFSSYHTQNSYYFGKWPFWTPLTFNSTDYHHAEMIYSNSDVPDVNYLYATYAYTVNTDGTYNSTAPNNYAHPLIFYNQTIANLYNITVDRYVNIVNDNFYKYY
jgi:hypothetical protein